MQITGTVVSVERDVDIPKKDGGSYVGTRLTYRDNQGSLKEQNWHPNGLKYNHAVRNSLDELEAGEKFTMTKEKGDNGMWNVKTLIKGVVASSEAPGKSYTPSKNNTGGGGNWPTSEERKETQTHIIRQNSVTNAVNYCSNLPGGLPLPSEVLVIAKQFEQFVLTGDTGDMNGLVSDDLDSGIE